MVLGYITNGLADIVEIQAVELLSAIGYRGVGFTLDVGMLNPFASDFRRRLDRTAETLRGLGMRSAIETGARFLLDPAIKHEPTLVTADPASRARRVDFLCRAVGVASALNSDCVSLWSGIVRDGADDREAMNRLVASLAQVMEYADQHGVALAFEPEPGMFIDTMPRFADLISALEEHGIDPGQLKLTIDVGHLHCQGELPIAQKLADWADRLVNVHIEDMLAGVHEHLMFGEGEIDFPPVIEALQKIGYSGLINVELSRHAHLGPQAARQAYDFLRSLVDSAKDA